MITPITAAEARFLLEWEKCKAEIKDDKSVSKWIKYINKQIRKNPLEPIHINIDNYQVALKLGQAFEKVGWTYGVGSYNRLTISLPQN
jgi:hypothetical protein